MFKKTVQRIGIGAASTALLGFSVFATVASAHVEVSPTTSVVNEEEQYTVRVPDEKNVATVKLVIKVPNGVNIQQYESVPGWAYSVQTSGGDQTSITWRATGQGLQPGQFQDFSFIAQNPSSEGQIAWDAFQYYKDGSIVEWTGGAGSETPHSITTITTAAAAAGTSGASPAPTTHDHGDASSAQTPSDHWTQAAATNPVSDLTSLVWLASGLALVSLFIAITAFSMVLRRK